MYYADFRLEENYLFIFKYFFNESSMLYTFYTKIKKPNTLLFVFIVLSWNISIELIMKLDSTVGAKEALTKQN